MQLSIVIPTYNQGQFIADCIESIVNQSFKDLEVIIQDSMSSDETERICKEYAKRDSRIQYFREKDSGSIGCNQSRTQTIYRQILDLDLFR
jgi:glycosyltransferase involved in cell wall biosynthesis